MEYLLILSSARFLLLLFGFVIFVGMSWLYLDAVSIRKQANMWLSGFGALVLAISFLLSVWEISGIEHGVRFLGYLLLGLGVWSKPMAKRVETNASNSGLVFGSSTPFALGPILAGFVFVGYFRLVYVGLERHLKKLAWGMLFVCLFELLAMRELFFGWQNPMIFELVRDYGILWIVQYCLLAFGLLLVGSWVFSYLLKRFETQLTLFLSLITTIVLASSVVIYSYFTVRGVSTSLINQSKVMAQLVAKSNAEKSMELLSRLKLFVESRNLSEALASNQMEQLKSDLDKVSRLGLLSRSWVLDPSGKTMVTWGGDSKDEMIDRVVFKKAQKDGEAFGYEQLGEALYILATEKIVSESGQVTGYIVFAKLVNSLDHSKMGTWGDWGVVSSLGETVVAVSDNKYSKLVGVKQTEKQLKEKVVERGESLSLAKVSILDKDFLGTWVPLTNANGTPIGSMAVVVEIDNVWNQIEILTLESYRVGILLLMFMLLPALWIATYLKKQI